jgi:hypothetical protein
MKEGMRRKLASEPFEEKVRKVSQMLRLVRRFPRKPKAASATCKTRR